MPDGPALAGGLGTAACSGAPINGTGLGIRVLPSWGGSSLIYPSSPSATSCFCMRCWDFGSGPKPAAFMTPIVGDKIFRLAYLLLRFSAPDQPMIGSKKARTASTGGRFPSACLALSLVLGRIVQDGDLVNADVACSSMQPKLGQLARWCRSSARS